MAFLAATRLESQPVEFFVDPDSREWRELEAAIDPVDGVRAFVGGGRLYAWLPPLLHEQVEPHLRKILGEEAGSAILVPVCIVPALHLVTVTTTLEPGLPDVEGLRRQVEEEIRNCAALQRRFRGGFSIRHAWRLARAA